MSILFSCWLLGACVTLVWCSLRASAGARSSCAFQESTQAGLEYITISSALLEEWAARDEHLIIMDLHAGTRAGGEFEGVPGLLRITPKLLGRYVRYLPPHTTLVLYGSTPATRLDAESESLLLRAGTQAVYTVEETTSSVDACATHDAWASRTTS